MMRRCFSFFPRECLVALAVMAAAMLLSFLVMPAVKDVRLEGDNREGQMRSLEIQRPFFHGDYQAPGTFKVTATLRHHALASTLYHIVPGQCLEGVKLNGAEIPLSGSDQQRHCDWTYGIDLDLAPYLVQGDNKLELSISNGGMQHVHFAPMLWGGSFGSSLVALAVIGMTLFFFAALLRRQDVDIPTLVIFVAGGLLAFNQLRTTGHWTYAHDLVPHVEYIRYIATHFSLPPSNYGAAAYHPPLYYTLAAIPYALFNHWGTIDPATAMRYLSLLGYLGFLCFGLLILRRYVHLRWLYYTAALLFVFWPRGVISAPAITNEGLGHMFYLGAFYYLTRWYQERNMDALRTAIILGAIGMTAKTALVTFFAMTGIMMLWQLIHRRLPRRIFFTRRWFLVYLVIAVAFGLAYGRTVYANLMYSANQPLSLGSAYWMPSSVSIPNTPANYLVFDYPAFMKAFLIDAQNSQYYANFLLKTSLFGEFNNMHSMPVLGAIMGFLLLTLVFYTFGSALFLNGKALREIFPALFACVVLIAASVAVTIHFPQRGCRDIRLIYPLILMACVVYARVVQWHKDRDRPLMHLGGMALALTFTAVSLIFLLAQQYRNVNL